MGDEDYSMMPIGRPQVRALKVRACFTLLALKQRSKCGLW